jgi:hypothetical protein
VESIGIDGYNQNLTGDKAQTLKGSRVDASNIPLVAQAAGFNGWRSETGTIEYEEERAPCLQANMPPNVCKKEVWPEKTRSLVARADGSPCIDRGQPFIYDARGNGDGKIANTLTGDHQNRISDYTALAALPIAISSKQQSLVTSEDVANTLGSSDYKEAQAVAIDCRNCVANEEISGTLQAKENGGQSLNYINPIAVHQNQCGEIRQGKIANANGSASDRNALLVATMQGFGDYKITEKASSIKSRDYKDNTDLILDRKYVVRRLTPTECERLQGYPDDWTKYGVNEKALKEMISIGKKKIKLPIEPLIWRISDSARYKTLGNSLAIPCVEFLLQRIKEAS